MKRKKAGTGRKFQPYPIELHRWKRSRSYFRIFTRRQKGVCPFPLSLPSPRVEIMSWRLLYDGGLRQGSL